MIPTISAFEYTSILSSDLSWYCANRPRVWTLQDLVDFTYTNIIADLNTLDSV